MTFDRPLITLAEVLALGTDALPNHPPAFAFAWMHLADEENPSEGVTAWAVGKGSKTATIQTSAIQTALLLEVTRCGITILTNLDRALKDARPIYYAKLILPDAPADNITVHRLLGAAEAGEKVSRDQVIPADLRGATIRKSGGASKKGAWETVYGHCKRYAEKAAEEAAAAGMALPFSVEAYLANLEALYLAATGQGLAEAAE